MNLFGFDISVSRGNPGHNHNHCVKVKECHKAQDSIKDSIKEKVDDLKDFINIRINDLKDYIQK